MEEKRKSHRIALTSKLVVKRIDNGKTEEIDIDVLNVSKTGIGFESTTSLTIGNVYESFLTIWTKEVIHAFIEIVRIEKMENGKYNYGGIFIGMPEMVSQRIEAYDIVSDPDRYIDQE